MKKLGLICLGASFLSVCMMEMHGLGYAVPTLVFAGLAMIFTYLMDKPCRAGKQAAVKEEEEAA